MQKGLVKQRSAQVGNVALRAISLGSRFALLFGLALWLEPAQIGLFGLFAATVAFCVLLIGADFYTHANRELLSIPKQRCSFILQHQLLALLGLYIVLLPPLLCLFWLELLPRKLLVWFFVLLVLEHLAQEVNRLLIVMGRPLIAGWVIFLRMGAWVWLLLLVMYQWPASRDLDTVFLGWAIGCLTALSAGGFIIANQVPLWRRWNWDIGWIMRGLRVGFLFLAASLSFRALFTLDRYVVDTLAGPEMLGVYAVYAGIALTVISFLDSAVLAFLYPQVVSARRRNNPSTYREAMRELTLSTFVVSLGLAVIIGTVAPVVLGWLARDIYVEHIPVLWLLLVASVLYAFSMVPHYGLYALGADKVIFVAHISSLLCFLLAVMLIAPYQPFASAAFGLIAAFLWMGLFKLWRYRNQIGNFHELSVENR